MPLVLDYTTPGGTNYPLSFWIIALISLNHLNRTGIVHVNGYQTVDQYLAGAEFLTQESFVFNDTAVYDSYVRFQLERPDSTFSFYVFLETAVLALTDFFAGSVPHSVTQPMAIEIGGESDDRVNVGFSNVLTGIGAGTGVVINVDGVPVTITGADENPAPVGDIFPNANPQPSFVVFYDLSSTVPVGSELDWNYDGGFVFDGVGALTDPSLNPLYKFNKLPIDTTIGEHLRFSRGSNSGQLMTLGVL